MLPRSPAFPPARSASWVTPLPDHCAPVTQAVALTCLWLAAKLEEVPNIERYMWKVLMVFDRVTKRMDGKSLEVLELHSKVSMPPPSPPPPPGVGMRPPLQLLSSSC